MTADKRKLTCKRWGVIILNLLPIIIIGFIIEGTFRKYSTWLLVLYLIVRTVIAVRILLVDGHIDTIEALINTYRRGKK